MIEIPRWADVEASMDAYDEESLRVFLREVLAKEIPGLPEMGPATSRVGRGLAAALHGHLGPWYQVGPRVGDETVEGWCWCHSFWKHYAGDDPASRLVSAVDGIVEQVQDALHWRRRLARFFWDLSREGAQEGMEEEVLKLLEVVLELGIHDNWYVHMHVVTTWYLQFRGVEVPKDLPEQLEALASTSFTSWVEPVQEARLSFSEQAAWLVVEAALDAH